MHARRAMFLNHHGDERHLNFYKHPLEGQVKMND